MGRGARDGLLQGDGLRRPRAGGDQRARRHGGFPRGRRGQLATHDSVFKQLGEGGLWGMFVVFAAVTAASFAPLARGKSVQETFLKNGKPEEFGPFNADAEMLN